MTRTRIPKRLWEYMTGSQAYSDRNDWAEAHDLMSRIESTRARADGSRHIELSDEERAIVRDYAEWLATAAGDDAGWDTSARADLNAARSVLRAIDGG